jgi:hypothetical protein
MQSPTCFDSDTAELELVMEARMHNHEEEGVKRWKQNLLMTVENPSHRFSNARASPSSSEMTEVKGDAKVTV